MTIFVLLLSYLVLNGSLSMVKVRDVDFLEEDFFCHSNVLHVVAPLSISLLISFGFISSVCTSIMFHLISGGNIQIFMTKNTTHLEIMKK